MLLTKRYYIHVLCEVKWVSELLLQTKTTKPTRWSKFHFWVGSYTRTKQLLSTYVQWLYPLSFFAIENLFTTVTKFWTWKLCIKQLHCIIFLASLLGLHDSITSMSKRSLYAFWGGDVVYNRITWYKKARNTSATFITSLSAHRIKRWPPLLSTKILQVFCNDRTDKKYN